MANDKQSKEPAANVNVNQRSADSSMTGIIIAVVLLLIGAILAFNYGWFGGSDAPDVTQNNTTTETAPDTTTSTTVTEPDTSTSTSTTTTEPSTTGTGTSSTTTTTTE